MYAVSKAVIFMALTHFTIVATGFYETRIAYYSWRGAEGYRFAAIPSYWTQVTGEVKNIVHRKSFRDCNPKSTTILKLFDESTV